ncbi:accessory gland protein Acp29AB [Drosophila gunungcola]|uniref:accessory gland protein Acp29AB n=1 Tax=Drosophila gunungcola TaxID=103775 RepID=UPI0022E31421|nr:accessory gland protein Acp29AB [Drosophila gunungcola]
MFKYATYFLYTFLVYDLYGVQAADQCTQNPLKRRGEVCLVELSPVLEHIANNKQSLSAETQKKLSRIEGREEDTIGKLKAVQITIESKLLAVEAKMSVSGDLKSLSSSVQETQRALLVSLESNRVKKNGQVPKGFQKIGSRYFYIEQNMGLDWFGAASKCHQMGAHLATIQNQPELDAIRKKTSFSNDFWLDITDLAKWGEYISIARGERPPFFKWDKNRPEAKLDQRCITLFKGKMRDEMCSKTLFFICQLAQ